MSNNQNDNNQSTIILPSDVIVEESSSVDYVGWIIAHYKEILSFDAASIPVLGVIFSFVFYIRNQAFNNYFNISDEWITISTTKDIYNLLYRGVLAATLAFPNIISLWIFLFNKKAIERVKKEKVLVLFSLLLMLALSIMMIITGFPENGSTKQYIGLSVILVSSMFLLPLIYILLNDFLSLVSVVLKYKRKAFSYLKNKLTFQRLFHPFVNFAKLVDKANEKILINTTANCSLTRKEISNNQKKGVIVIIATLMILVIGFVLIAREDGKQDAESKKNFYIIDLTESIEDCTDLKDYDDKGKKYLEVPYVKYELDNVFNTVLNDKKSVKDFMLNPPKNKRIINTYTVLAESDDSFLIANSFLDKSKNTPELYIFTDEQTIIDKKDVRIKKMNFIKAPELR